MPMLLRAFLPLKQLREGQHKRHSVCELLGIRGAADVFFSHTQGERVYDTLEMMRRYERQHPTKNGEPQRYWLDYASLRQGHVTWVEDLKSGMMQSIIQSAERVVMPGR